MTAEDVQNFIREKNVRTSCGECGHSVTALSFERSGRTPSIISLPETDPDIFKGVVHGYYQLVCLNCGHLRMFEKAHVALWKIGEEPK